MDERGGGRLAVGAGDADHLVRRQARRAPARTIRCRRSAARRPARALRGDRVAVERHARRNDDAVKPARSISSGSAIVGLAGDRRRALPPRLSQAVTSAPLATSASTVASARAREAEDGVALAAKGGAGDHRSFSVARPASASTKAMIQKRITTVGSDQPDLLEMVVDRRHPEDALAGALVDKTWMITLIASTTNRPPMMPSTISWRVDDRDRAERAAEREAAGIAHEDRRRRRVEPEEGEARADDRRAEHGQLAGAEHVRDAEIGGEDRRCRPDRR